MPEISIVMPVYGVEKYIGKSIQSICQQTYQDFELILVDDGCIDRSIEVAQHTLTRCDAHFPYKIIRQDNAGVSAARNAGIQEAKGKWVICIDPDDFIHPRTMERITECLKKDAGKHDLLWFDYQNVTNHFDDYISLDEPLAVSSVERDEIIRDFLYRKRKLIIPAVLVRRSFILENELWYDPACKFSEDVLLMWKYLYASAGICFIEEKLYYYLSRPGSTMTASSTKKIMTGYYAFDAFAKQLTTEYPDDSCVQLIFPRWIIGALHSAARMMDYKGFKSLVAQMDYKPHMSKLLRFKDYRVTILSVTLQISKRMFYSIARGK